MAINHYLVGSTVVVIGSCSVMNPLTEVETPTDPDTVTFRRIKPDGSNHEYVLGVAPEVVKLAEGIHVCTVTVDQTGKEKWRYEGTGACAAVAEDIFEVEGSVVL